MSRLICLLVISLLAVGPSAAAATPDVTPAAYNKKKCKKAKTKKQKKKYCKKKAPTQTQTQQPGTQTPTGTGTPTGRATGLAESPGTPCLRTRTSGGQRWSS